RRARTRPARAHVVLGAGVAIVARGPVGGVRVRAHTGRGIAGAGDVALVARRAHESVEPRAGHALGGVGLGAGVPVVARGPVCGVRVRAHTGRGIAGAGDVARAARRAHDRIAPDAGPALAGVGLGAGVPVVARGPVGGVRVRAHTGRGIAGAGDVALVARRAHDRIAPAAGPALAGGGLGAVVAGVAGQGVVRVRAPDA